MTNSNGKNHHEPLDPQLEEYLSQLAPVPPRNPRAAERSRNRFLTELKSLPPSAVAPPQPAANANKSILTEGKMTPAPKSRLFVFSALAAILVVLFLLGGSAMTALAAQSAIPGDALYPVKTSLEQTRYSLARDAGDRAQMQIQYAGLRLQEIERLIAEGRLTNVAATTSEFEAHIRAALADLEIVASQDPERATTLLAQITTSLSRYAAALNDLMASMPEGSREDVRRALDAVKASGGLQNDNSNGNANGNDNLNDNLNGNTNDSINGNANDGLNGNGNANDNLNSNANDNDGINGNANDGLINDNDNGDDNGNDNTSRGPAPAPVLSAPVNNGNDNDNGSPASLPSVNYNNNDNDNDSGGDNDNNNGNDNDD